MGALHDNAIHRMTSLAEEQKLSSEGKIQSFLETHRDEIIQQQRECVTLMEEIMKPLRQDFQRHAEDMLDGQRKILDQMMMQESAPRRLPLATRRPDKEATNLSLPAGEAMET